MTAAGGAGLTGNVQINVQGQGALDALAKSIVVATQDVLKLAQSMPTLDAAQQKQIRSMTQQVALYTKAATLANTWATASLKAAEAEKTQASAADTLTRAISANKTALEGLTSTTQRSFDGKSRTIALSQQNAQVLLTEAQAAKTAAEAQQLLAKAQRDVATATRTQQGKGEPISDYDKARLALQNKALAARTAQQAVDAAAKADLAATTAAARLAASTQNAAAAQQRRAQAAAAAAAATRESAAAADAETRSVSGSYFALYQVAAAYGLISKAASSIVTGAVSTAASFQASFNNVIRTTGLLGDTSEMAQSQVALLKNQLTGMSEVIPVSLEDVAKIAALGGQLGIQAGDIASFTDVVAKFSALTGISADNTALAFGRITNLLGVNTDQYDALASTVLDLGTKSAATEAEILGVTQSIAATGKEAGLSVPDVLGLSTAMASLKIPAELGRGSLTRLFVQISSGASEGAKGVEAYAKVMGISADEALRLQQTDPSTFFTDLIRGLGQSSANGQDLNNVLDSIGIKNSRDIPVITRLAQNYNLLANNIQEAQVEISKPAGQNSLAAQANLIFSGLSAKAKEFGNTFRAALANLGGSALAPLTLLLQPLSAFVQLLGKIPAVVTGPIVAVTAFVAAMAAYRAAVAIGLAATLAFQNALAGNTATIGLRSLAIAASETFGTGALAGRLGASSIAASNAVIGASAEETAAAVAASNAAQVASTERLIAAQIAAGAEAQLLALQQTTGSGALAISALQANMLTQAYVRKGTAASASAAATALDTAALELETIAGTEDQIAQNQLAAANLRVLASQIALAPALAADTVLMEAETAAAAELAAAETAAATAGKFLGLSMGGWALIAVGVVAAAAAIASHFANAKSESDQLAEAATKVKSEFLDAVGGIDALNNAITKDTNSAADLGDSAAGSVQKLVRHVTDLHNGMAQVVDQFEDMNGNKIEEVSNKTVAYADSVLDAAHNTDTAKAAQDEFGKSAGLSADQLERQTAIIGKQTQALAAQALQKAVFGGKDSTGAQVTGILSSNQQEDLGKFLAQQGKTLGGVLGTAFKAGTTQGAAGLTQTFAPYIADLNRQLDAFKAKAVALPKYDPTQGNTVSNQNALQAQADIAATQGRIDAINKLIESYKGQSGALHDAVVQDSAYGDIMKAMGASTDDVTNETDGMSGALGTAAAASGAMGAEAQSAAQHLNDMASAFQNVISGAFETTTAVGDTQAAVEALGAGLVANGTDFTNYTEAGRSNMANLKAVIQDYGAELANQVKNGEITTEIAAQQMQAYVQNLVQTLASQGVDTTQIDFLVNYVNQFTANPAILSITADGTGAYNVVNDVLNAVQQANMAVANLPVQLQASGGAIAEGFALNGGDTSSAPAFDDTQYRNSSDAANHLAAASASKDMSAARQDEAASALQAAQAEAQYQSDLKAAQEQDRIATQAAQESAQQAGDAAKDEAADTKAAGKAAKSAAQDKVDAAKAAEDALKREADWVQAVGGYYANLADSATSGSSDSGKVISSLQELGNTLATNGTTFDQFSESGRKNLSALTGALDAYGSSLNTKLQNGSITVDQAGASFAQFAGGVRQDLLGLGVPAQAINQLFASLNAGSGWANTTADVSQYSGVVGKAASDSTAFGDAAKAATDKAGESAKQLAEYYSAVDDYFKKISTNAFQFVSAEGDVFNSLQELGAALVENGNSFNTVTKLGRDNFSALSDVFDKFGANLALRISSGAITAEQGSKQYAAFASQTYRQLVKLGVKAADIAPFFRALGIDLSKTYASAAAVDQYNDVLTASAAAARAAATGTTQLGTAMDAAADYADRLGTALSTAYDRLHGLAAAQDSVTTAVQGMSDAYQSNIDKIKELQDANKGLQADQASAQSAYDVANRKYLLALKYGQKDAAKKYLADRDTAGDQVTNDTTQINKNATDAAELTKYGSSLTGNTKEAIANRAAYLALQKTMLDQVSAYAKTGASTKQVAAYTANLKKQFEEAGKSAGFSKADIKKYSDSFTSYITVIRSIPRNVGTRVTMTADTDAATSALNAIPKNATFRTTAVADTAKAVATLQAVPKRGNFQVTASAEAKSVNALRGVLNSFPKKQALTITPVMEGGDIGGKTGANLARHSGLSAQRMTITAAADAVSAAHARAELQRAAGGAIGVALQAVNSVLGVLGISVGNSGINTPSMNVSGTVNAGHLNQRAAFMGGIAGYSSGGLLGGTPPVNPHQDNLRGTVNGKPISLRSKEFIVQQPSVEYYGVGTMNALNQRRIPRSTFSGAFYSGGQPGGGGGAGGGGGNGGPLIAQLSSEDRRMLRRAIDRPIVTVLDGAKVSKSQARQNAAARKSGAIV